MEIGIYVVAGKPIDCFNIAGYRQIIVGDTSFKHESDWLTDKGGDSISGKNPYYCELTALYWLWKNHPLEDIVGMCHYRRFFDFLMSEDWEIEQADTVSDISNNIGVDVLQEVFCNYDIVLPVHKPLTESVEEQYCRVHRRQDWQIMKEVMKRLYPEYMPAAEQVFSGNCVSVYNMLVTRREIFCDYMEWLFSILFEVEKKVEIPYEDKVQRRVFGYMAERLLNVYVRYHALKVKEVPIIFLANGAVDDCSVLRDWRYRLKDKHPRISRRIKKMKDLFLRRREQSKWL